MRDIGVRIYDLDKRSRRNIVTTLFTIKMCKEYIDKYIEEGYGINLIPELDLLSNESKEIWLELICDIVEEMIKSGQEVIAIERSVDRNLQLFMKELNKRNINLPIKMC